MKWPSIRDFLGIPAHLTGKGIAIAVIDGSFPPHPDITTNDRRHTYVVNTVSTDVKPQLLHAEKSPWKNNHGLMTAAAAAGSGTLSSGYYSGAASEADLYLLETGPFPTLEETEKKFVMALRWLIQNSQKYNIRGVVLTVAYTRDTGLLPWQVDPIKVHCEQLVKEGVLVVVASGNTRELTCSGPASSPSVLSVGGVIVPSHLNEISPYHGCQVSLLKGKEYLKSWLQLKMWFFHRLSSPLPSMKVTILLNSITFQKVMLEQKEPLMLPQLSLAAQHVSGKQIQSGQQVRWNQP